MTARVSTRLTTSMLLGFKRLGADPDELCRDIGADPEVLRAPDSRVSVVVLAKLWLSAERMLRDPMIGLHTAEAVGPTGLLPYLMMTQPTVGQSIESFISSTRLASDNLEVTLDRAPATTAIGIHFAFRSGPGVAQTAEYVCGLLASHLHLTTAGRLVPDRVDFMHCERGPKAEYRRILQSEVRSRGERPRRTVLLEPGSIRTAGWQATRLAIARERRSRVWKRRCQQSIRSRSRQLSLGEGLSLNSASRKSDE
ncbi:MAG: AraC family transcriptional regulator ligand-binding domain-containing protein [Myxococcota bacterium]